MAEDGAIAFTITQEGGPVNGKEPAPRSFQLLPGKDAAILIGRTPVNDLVIPYRGVSQYHCEIRLTKAATSHVLCVRDLSMNGTGLKRPDGKYVVPAVTLAKGVDETLSDGCVIVVPMNLKEDQPTSDRSWLRVQYANTPASAAAAAVAASGEVVPVVAKTAKTKHSKDVGRGAAKSSKMAAAHDDDDDDAGKDPAKDEAEDASASGSGQEDDEDDGPQRQEFVNLLLNTKAIGGETTYEEAKQLLSSEAGWQGLKERPRKECFTIFVGHLGGSKRSKGGKKKKDKGKTKKHKSRKEDVAQSASGSEKVEKPHKNRDQKPRDSKDKKRDRKKGGGRSEGGGSDTGARARSPRRRGASRSRGGRRRQRSDD